MPTSFQAIRLFLLDFDFSDFPIGWRRPYRSLFLQDHAFHRSLDFFAISCRVDFTVCQNNRKDIIGGNI